MSNEEAVPEPLSGREIVEAIKTRVGEQLERDCYMSPNAAYEYFFGKIHIEITAVDCGREAVVNKNVDVTLGTDSGKGTVIEATSTVTIPKEAPNVVRKNSQQPVPVLVEDASGKRTIKRVQYSGRQPGKTTAAKEAAKQTANS